MISIDEYSVSTVPIQMFFNETFLSLGTGFVWKFEDQTFLITNWHNVSGKNPNTGKHLSDTLAEPNKLRIWWNVKNKLGDKRSMDHQIRDNDGNPCWLVHPKFKQNVDVVALPVDFSDDLEPYPINSMTQSDLMVQIGMDVFILGYPYGNTQGGLPVWKRGSLATEPQLATATEPPHLLLDTASRPGMSGSPVILRSWGTHLKPDGGIALGQNAATQIIGIYSGRIAANDPLDAQLGITWPKFLIEEILAANYRDSLPS